MALVVAGGTGSRLGASVPKQMLPLRGRPILAHTLDAFLAFGQKIEVCTVLHASLLESWPEFVRAWFPAAELPRLHACAGGPDRTHSVSNGLDLLAQLPGTNAAIVAIHDSVRPFLDARILDEGYALAAQKGNAVAAVPVKSSLRMRTPKGSQAIDRNNFFQVQTPQFFQLETILDCYASRPSQAFTDDASLAEAQGMNIHLFSGSYDNIKITTPEDLLIAGQIHDRRQK